MAARANLRIRKALLFVYYLLGVLVCSTLASCAFLTPAYAYVDPSVMTYTIQAIAGVAVALSAVAGVAFRRSRKALMRLLHIDENAHKEIEQEVYLLDENGQPIGANESELTDAPSSKREKRGSKQQEEKGLSWPSRLWRAVLVSVFLIGTVFLVAPSEVVAANSGSIFFSLADVWWGLVIRASMMALCLAVVLSLFRGRIFSFLLVACTALGLCFYVQALFLNVSLPSADGTPLVLSDHKGILIVSSLVWLAIVAGAILLFAKRPRSGRVVSICISTVLVVVQCAAVASLWFDPTNLGITPETTKSEHVAPGHAPTVSEEGLFEIAPSNNIVIFVLDAFDVINMNDMLDRNPRSLDEFEGFTYFSNSTGSSVPTRYGVPYLLTGSWPKADESWDDYIANRYTSSSFLDDVLAQDYSMYVYTDTAGPGGFDYLSSRTANVHPIDESKVHTETTFNQDGALAMAYRMALYRDMPWLLKKPFWFYTAGVNSAAFTIETYEEHDTSGQREGANSHYIMDDATYYERLCQKGLSLHDDGTKGSLRFIHLNGAHIPFTLDEHARRLIGEPGNVDRQCEGAILIVSEYLGLLKNLGVYDDATIIVTADHGYWFWDDTIEQSELDGDMAGGPIMLVKPAGAPSRPLDVSDARTGHLDFQATVIDAVGGNSSKYGSTVFEANEPNRIRYYYWPTHDGSLDLMIYEYAIDGEVTDFSTWSRTGVEWEYGKPAGAIVN